MKFINVFTAVSVASLHAFTNAMPLARANAPSEIQVLNFALALEHLESAFYKAGLDKFKHEDFVNAGFPKFSFGRYNQIKGHEGSHVVFLEGALKELAVQPCEYNFPFSDVKGFVELSDMLEIVGSAAYTGAAKLLSTPAFLTAAASILSTESRQSAFIGSAIRGLNGWSTDTEAPLDVNQAFTLAAGLIKSCPDANKDKLIAVANPQLTVKGTQKPGATVTLEFEPKVHADQFTAAFISGLKTIFVPIKYENGCWTVTIPENLIGVSFLVITSDPAKADDSVTVAGPAFLSFPFDENEKLIG